MGNPQERWLAWVAAIVEAEGSISFQVGIKNGRLGIQAYVCVVNKDMAILGEVKRVFDALLEGSEFRRANPRFCNHSGSDCYNLRVDGNSCTPILRALEPYFVGAKRRNAAVVLEYLDIRRRNFVHYDRGTGRIRRVGYSKAEVDLVCSIRTHMRAKSSETIRQARNYTG